MNATKRQECIAKGLWLDGSRFFGSENDSIRSQMKAAGAVFDGKSSPTKWVFPTAESMRPFEPTATGVPATVTMPNIATLKVPNSPISAPKTTTPTKTPKTTTPTKTPKTTTLTQMTPAQMTPNQMTPNQTPKSKKASKTFLKSLPPAGLPRPAPNPPKFPKLEPKASLPLAQFPKPAALPDPIPITQGLASPEVSPKSETTAKPEASKSEANPKSETAAKPDFQVNGKTVQVGTWSRSSLMRLPAALLVTQSVMMRGAVEYFTEDETREYTETDGTITTRISKKIQKIVTDEEEHKLTKATTNRMRNKIRSLGIVVQPGVIRVRKSKQEALDQAMETIEAEALEHNRNARYHFIRLLISYEETSEESVKYAQQFAYLLQEGMDRLRLAIDACDVKKIRDEASAFKNLAKGTTNVDGQLILESVKEARKIASFVDQEVNKKSRQISDVKQRLNTEAIDSIRMKFLQYEVPPAMEAARQSIEKGRFANLESETIPAPMVVNGGIEPGRFSK